MSWWRSAIKEVNDWAHICEDSTEHRTLNIYSLQHYSVVKRSKIGLFRAIFLLTGRILMSLFKISYKEKSIHIIQEFSGKKCKTIVHSVPTFDQINFWNQAVIASTNKVWDFFGSLWYQISYSFRSCQILHIL